MSTDDTDSPDIGDIFDQLEELAETVDSEEERNRVEEAMELASEASRSEAVFGRIIWGFDRADATEALLGALLFGIPMAVEGGTQEIGSFLATRPLLLAGTVLFTLSITTGVLYVAEIQDVRVRYRLLGIVPFRLAGVLTISFLLAVVMLTAWGRVDWTRPAVALANVVVAFLPMSIGGALGDILPGS
ncbi:DUF2391 family protein [Halapricum hydrolyticum]|uniref:DUF2391 family protein n=1 Tax=Halapricum hydrolyticum TaxID=2979991 RepID=A0AAE3IEV8_9EURY|nr:DUF2391 family protein [Halapricum hydrolyticum]MCU4719029.1 DUF2391 family protein [Halapricum hydrolyticum]MCU4728018.1 DUF2391 family protein [Halapricum hydrolyticum]